MRLKFQEVLMPIAILAVICNSAAAFEFATSRGIGMGQTLVLSDPSATSLLLVPTSGIEPGEWIVELGGMREYELSELNCAYLAAATRYGNYIVAVGISQLGERDYYAERTGKVSFAYRWWDYAFAVNLSGLEYSFGGNYSSERAAAAGLGISYYHHRFYLGLAADNLNSPKVTDGSPAINPQISLYGEFIGKETFSMTARATFEKDESVQLALGQKIDVSRRGAIFWGFGTEPFQLGGGFDFWYSSQGALTYAFGYHPTLGISHNLSLIYHFGKKKKPDDAFE